MRHKQCPSAGGRGPDWGAGAGASGVLGTTHCPDAAVPELCAGVGIGTWPQMLPQACFCLLGGSTHCCDIYSGKGFSCWRHWLCLVGGLGEEQEWRKECGRTAGQSLAHEARVSRVKAAFSLPAGDSQETYLSMKPEDRYGRRPRRRTKRLGQEKQEDYILVQ